MYLRARTMMFIAASFDRRTLTKMSIALEQVCSKTKSGERHEVRKRVAKAIIQCAKGGKTTLEALTAAGDKVLWRLSEKAA